MKGQDGYSTWCNMRDRCRNPKNRAWQHYGGRGVRVCARWDSFALFMEDMGPRPTPKHSIDRVDNDGNYEPGNCRWATPSEQTANRRNSCLLTFNGRTQSVALWSKETGLTVDRIRGRVWKKWPVDLVLSTAPGIRFRPRADRRGERNGASILTLEQAREIRRRVASGEKQAPVARAFGVSKTAVWQIVHGLKWASALGGNSVEVERAS